ncbi:HNH endonuclease [Shouchella clausii]|uniref:HNH endonuclease n=1 Tax=Shouchella clausii TaxID=79880 RepID=A0A268NW09_SHOCL|nr:HNH endonuclease signature motif containing protein [Shouchella clausii]PAE87666.1 HNH endonuclease [Shouchella clausii]
MAANDEHLAFSSGIALAGWAISNFWDYNSEAFSCFKDEIIESIVKPNKLTAVHHYLYFFQDIADELDNLYRSDYDLVRTYDFIFRILEEVNLKPNIPPPDFDGCGDEYHEKCNCKDVVEQLIGYIKEHQAKINELIVHAAFQFIFQDRRFLHDFHLELSIFIEENMEEIEKQFPEYVTNKKRIKRVYFPRWLTDAVFYRDKGTCSNPECRCDLSNLIRTQNTKHIDHIVPLDLHGSNDASNFQLLCQPCNTSKGAKSTASSSVNAPYWNIENKV